MQPFDYKKWDWSKSPGVNFPTPNTNSDRQHPVTNAAREQETTLDNHATNLKTNLPTEHFLPFRPIPPLKYPLNHMAAAMTLMARYDLDDRSINQSILDTLAHQPELMHNIPSILHDTELPENPSTNELRDTNHALDLSHESPNTSTRESQSSIDRMWNPLSPTLGEQYVDSVTGRIRFRCNICRRTYCSKQALKEHVVNIHQGNTYECLIEGCGKIFTYKGNRDRHSRTTCRHLRHVQRLARITQQNPMFSHPPSEIPSEPSQRPLPELRSLLLDGSPMLRQSDDLRNQQLSAIALKVQLDLQHKLREGK